MTDLDQFEEGGLAIFRVIGHPPRYHVVKVLRLIPATEERVDCLEIELPVPGAKRIEVSTRCCIPYSEHRPERPFSYREEECCAQCEHVFVRGDYDEGPRYYCLKNAVHPRVRCGSVAMGECSPDTFFYDTIDRYYDFKEVAAWGTCDHYKKGEG